MLQKIQKTVEKVHMIESGDRVLSGLSGGADSVALLLALKELQGAMDFSLEAIHVEHGIRGKESLSDAAFAKKLCEGLGVAFRQISVDAPDYAKEKGLSLEEAARILRYKAFEECAMGHMKLGAGKVKVALAHHEEDNAETILFQMVRGSGLTGLSGMKPVRETESGIFYIRPLLELHRRELEAWLSDRQVGFCTDSTNGDIEYTRNYIRHEILPRLKEINPQAVEHMNQAAAHLREVDDFLQKEVEKAWNVQMMRNQKKANIQRQLVNMGIGDSEKQGKTVSEAEAWTLDIDFLKSLHPAIQKELVLNSIGLVMEGLKDIGFSHVEQVLSLCEKQSGRRLSLPQGVAVQRTYGELIFKKEVKPGEGFEPYTVTEEQLQKLEETGQMLEIILKGEAPHRFRLQCLKFDGDIGKIPKSQYTKWLNYDKIREGFCIRRRESGDYFLYDEAGHKKKLKQYFVDEKIPESKRESIPLVAAGSEILWVVGGRLGEGAKLSKDSQTILEITYLGGK